MADGSIVFSTALDNSDLEKSLKQAEKRIDALKRKIEEKTSERNAIAEEMFEVKAAIEQAKEEQRDFDDLLDRGVALAERYNVAEAELEQYNSELKETTALQKRLGAEYAETYRSGSMVFSNAMTSVEDRFTAFTSKINKRLKKLFVFSFIFGALSTFKKYLVSVVEEDERFSASVSNLVATLTGLIAPLVNMLIPALTAIVNVLTAMITTLARLVDMVFKTDLMGSISRAREAARAAAAATDDETQSTNKLAKAKKKAAKYLAAFDELNKMDAEDSQDAADALNDQAEAVANADALDWDAFDVGKIDAKLAEIMLIVGAALMAVGAILAFSGINIPLGLTLMAIGALMVYTAAREQWDKLPSEVRNAINAALVITGVVLLVIGAVLAFSGANIPLGIGMMIAGAVLLATAAALNWDKLPSEVQTVITIIMGVLGGALLVIGAILALSGANIPLGVGLMAAGAISLATVAILNWDKMSDEVRGVVVTITSIVSVAFIAIGAILAFSGANLPLGIGLMAAGAVGLIASVILAWDKLPENIRGTVGTIAAIVGGALLVLGIILCVAGVSLPLGIALIIAGAASLVAAVALNWDKIKNNVSGTVTTIALIAGGALLVLGIILCAAGVSLPLGVALIVAGAASLAAAAALNWDKLPKNVKKTITTIGLIVGGALLVLGIILCVAGVSLPLGIALIAAGAASLVGIAALNWNKMSNNVRNTVSTIAAIAGGALLVLGIILCVTGVGIPLGVALILAGAGSLAAAMAVNWDAIKNKIAEVWNGIKTWFKQNVAPIFTAKWWGDKFSSIGKGLVNALTGAATAFHNFIVGICDNIGGALSMLGESWSYSIPRINIPALASGAVIPPNRKFLAVLGDQTSGRNLEAPESLIRQIVREEAGGADAMAMQQAFTAALIAVLPMLQQQDAGGDVTMVLQVGNEELARATNKGNAALARRGLITPELNMI